MKVLFDELSDLAGNADAKSYNGQVFSVLPPSCDTADKIITINVSGTFSFDPIYEYECDYILIKGNVVVSIAGMKLKGGIRVKGCRLKMQFCSLKFPKSDYFVLCEEGTEAVIENSNFHDTKLFGIGLDSSVCTLMACTVNNTVNHSVIATGHSRILIESCSFGYTNGSHMYLDSQSECTINESNFLQSNSSSLFLNSESRVIVNKSLFRNNKHGAITLYYKSVGTIKECEVYDSYDTSILIDDSLCDIIDTRIIGSEGNGINASNDSIANIYNSHLASTQWPLIVVCDSSFCRVFKCSFEDSQMSAIVARNRSSLEISDCKISDSCECGIRIAFCKNVKISKCQIWNINYEGISIYDQSSAFISDCIIAGKVQTAIGVFTGGHADCNGLFLLGPFDHAVRVHHGGSANVSDCRMIFISNEVAEKSFLDISKMIKLCHKTSIDNPLIGDNSDGELINNDKPKKKLLLKDLFKAESKWSLSVINSYFYPYGSFELNSNSYGNYNPNIVEQSMLNKCIHCQQYKKLLHYVPCGHQVYCKECWHATETKPKRCEYCFLPVDKATPQINVGDESSSICPICYSNKTDGVIIPCGHMLCHDCSHKWDKTSPECPFCREEKAQYRGLVPYE